MNIANDSVKLADINLPGFATLFLKMVAKIQKGHLRINLPSGEVLEFEGAMKGEDVTIRVNDWNFAKTLFLKGDIGLGESYINGDWDCDNINDLIKLGIDNQVVFEQMIKGSILKILFYRVKHLLNRNSKKGSMRNIHAHYDLGNEFYKLWLDKTMTYSSGIFKWDDDSLEQAQKNKYQRVIDQLGLKAGDSVLEIGCGWGGFMEHAAQQGIKVTGVTISKEQFNFATERVRKYGELCEVKLKDYRDLEGGHKYIVSIEMFEALGEQYWKTYFNKIKEILLPNGKALIQTITINDYDFNSYRKGTDFIQQYIFPGGMLPSPKAFEKTIASLDLKLLDKFEFGLDYAKTLSHWDQIYKMKKIEIDNLGFDQRFNRTWHFYLKYCQGGFEAKKISVFQYMMTY